MKIITHFASAVVFCLAVFAFTAQAQIKFLMSARGQSGSVDRPGLYYFNKDGTGITPAASFNDYKTFGDDPEYFIVHSDGEIVGINATGGMEDPDQGYGYGTLYRITARGVIPVQDFNYAEASRTYLTEGADKGLYGTGASALREQILYGTKEQGLSGSEIGTYGFIPAEILGTANGDILGYATVGGANGQGYIYKFWGGQIQIIYSFSKPTGYYPQGRLLQGQDGLIYGVTRRGGKNDLGVIYKMKPDGTGYTVMFEFGSTSGGYPDRGLVQDPAGNLFGVTSQGGANQKGTIFKIKPDGTGFTKVHDLAVTGPWELAVKQSLIYDENYLYGMLPKAVGQFFRMKVDGTDFRLIINADINMHAVRLVKPIRPAYKVVSPAYGATNVATSVTVVADSVPGAANYALQISTNPTFQGHTIQTSSTHRFNVTGLSPGTLYYARIRTSLWNSYGPLISFTTASSSGFSIVTTPANNSINAAAPTLKVTVKAVTGAKRYTVQLSTTADFSGASLLQTSAFDDQRTLTFSGLKYSAKYYARVRTDINPNYGTAISFTTKAESFSKVTEPANAHTQTEPDVLKIVALPLAQAKRYTLQISTSSTFASNTKTYNSIEDNQNSFVVRDLNYNATYYTRVKTDISTTWGPVTRFSTRNRITQLRIWGTTTLGGAYDAGTLYSFSVDSLKFTKHHDGLETDRINSTVALGPDGIYGHTYDYVDFYGKVFRFSPEGGFQETVDCKLTEYTEITMASSGRIYAVSEGWELQGKITRVNFDLNTYKSVFYFSNPTGGHPTAGVLELGDGFFYGTAYNGGTNGAGVIYKVKPDGTGYQVLKNFSFGTNPGGLPYAGLSDGKDGYLYGATSYDGGTLYRIKTDGTDFKTLHVFGHDAPGTPIGELLVMNGVIYGTAAYSFYGGVFKMNTDGSGFSYLIRFNDENGSNPVGPLTTDGKGYLYGTTQGGGLHGHGTIFRIKTDGTGHQILFSFSPETGYYGDGNIIVTEDDFKPMASAAMGVAMSPVNVYPNPSTNSFTLTPTDANSLSRIEITDSNGSVIFQSDLKEAAVEFGQSLPKGIYVLKVLNNNQLTTHRLVKK